MIAEFLNRDVVLAQLAELEALVAQEREGQRRAGLPTAEQDLVLDELAAAGERERLEPSGQTGFEPPPSDRRGPEPAPLDDFAFLSRDPVISLLQSALEAAFEQPEHAEKVREEAPVDDDRRGDGDGTPLVADRSLVEAPEPVRTDDRRLFDKFSVTDPLFVRAKLAEGIRLLRGRHSFNETPAEPVQIPSRARLVLVGDWGTGIPRARAVAAQMRAAIGEALDEHVAVHVVHLGDVYYSGWGHEYRSRFLRHWPVGEDQGETVGSWCLPGNHDLYSGGHAYYEVALGDPRFAPWHAAGNGPSSFFSLVHPDWKILGLDTAWEDAGLKDPQSEWLADELRTAGGRKTLLLSHHQLFSTYEEHAEALAEKVAPILARHPVTGWFWGHEHRCMLFADHANVRHARCLGDGGVPTYQWRGPGDPYPPPGAYEHRRFIPRGLERWAVMGFAVLDFDGPTIDVRYLDEDGHEHHHETLG